MVDFDLRSYSELYLKNAKEEIQTLRGLLKEEKDIVILHRLTHSLKGQSYFMRFNDIGDKAKELEFFFKSLLDKNESVLQNSDFPNNTLDEIESLLLKIKV